MQNNFTSLSSYSQEKEIRSGAKPLHKKFTTRSLDGRGAGLGLYIVPETIPNISTNSGLSANFFSKTCLLFGVT